MCSSDLAGLRMQADLAQREGASALELTQSLQHIGRASMRATHTVNQLLSLARAESGGANLARQPCNLVELVTEVIQESLPRALDRHIDLGYEGVAADYAGVWVSGNRTLLKELFRNLIDNAIHYTPSSEVQPGVVTVRVLADRFSGVAVFQVEDTGPGIAAEPTKSPSLMSASFTRRGYAPKTRAPPNAPALPPQ